MPGVEPDTPRCKRGALPVSFIPKVMPDSLESKHHSARRWRYRPMSSRMLSVRSLKEVAGRIRTGVAGITTRNVCLYTTATAGTAGLIRPTHPASRLTSERSGRLSYTPVGVARVGFEPTVSSS
jgi:hypothetical protein